MFYIAQILHSIFDYHILEIKMRSVQRDDAGSRQNI